MESKWSTSASSGRSALIASAMEVLPEPEAPRKDHKSHLDHRMQPDLGVGNLSRLSQAPNAAILKGRLCIRVIGFARSL